MKTTFKTLSLTLAVFLSTSALASSQCDTYLSFDHNGHRMTEGRLFPSLVAKNVLVCVNNASVHPSWESALKKMLNY